MGECMLTVITPAGDRHEAWALSQQYMAAQDYPGPVRWIVIDDGHEPLAPEFSRSGYELEIHRLDPMAENSQCRNLLHAVDLIDGDGPVVCWEDDDVYLPGHLSTMAEALETVELAGEGSARYFHVGTRRYRLMSGLKHSSLCATAMRGEATRLFRQICARGEKFIDLKLWRSFTGPKKLLDTANCIGVKGMPGREGIGVGHKPTFGTPDTSGVLQKWAGEYSKNYEVFG